MPKLAKGNNFRDILITKFHSDPRGITPQREIIQTKKI